MYKVIVTARSFGQANDAPIKLLEEHGCEVVRVATGKPLTTEELIPHIADADAVIAGLDNYNKEVIEAGKKLKVISRYGVGYDKVDVCTARAKDIAVTITPGANEHSVADLAMALMLSAARHVTPAAELLTRRRSTPRSRRAKLPLLRSTLLRSSPRRGARCSSLTTALSPPTSAVLRATLSTTWA